MMRLTQSITSSTNIPTVVEIGCQKIRHHLALLCFIIIILVAIIIIGNTLWEPDILSKKPTSRMMMDMLFSYDSKLVATIVDND